MPVFEIVEKYTLFSFSIGGHLSAKNAKSAKFVKQRKTAKFCLPLLADFAATANFMAGNSLIRSSLFRSFAHSLISLKSNE